MRSFIRTYNNIKCRITLFTGNVTNAVFAIGVHYPENEDISLYSDDGKVWINKKREASRSYVAMQNKEFKNAFELDKLTYDNDGKLNIENTPLEEYLNDITLKYKFSKIDV